jgi:hypothetical protein
MSIADELLRDVERFIEQHGISPSVFGLLAVNDGHLVRDLRDGVDIRSSRIDRVRKFMAEYRAPRPKRRAEARAALG